MEDCLLKGGIKNTTLNTAILRSSQVQCEPPSVVTFKFLYIAAILKTTAFIFF
jgi:hypothetical protein